MSSLPRSRARTGCCVSQGLAGSPNKRLTGSISGRVSKGLGFFFGGIQPRADGTPRPPPRVRARPTAPSHRGAKSPRDPRAERNAGALHAELCCHPHALLRRGVSDLAAGTTDLDDATPARSRVGLRSAAGGVRTSYCRAKVMTTPAAGLVAGDPDSAARMPPRLSTRRREGESLEPLGTGERHRAPRSQEKTPRLLA